MLHAVAELAKAEETAALREVAARKAALELEQARQRSSRLSASSETTGRVAFGSDAAPPTTAEGPDWSTTLAEDLERLTGQDLGP